MLHPTVVIDVVALTGRLLDTRMPKLLSFAATHPPRRLTPVLPAVTSSVQSSMITGGSVASHGIVANGWYDRTRAEVAFWKQSNHLVQGPKVWETARERDASFTCANLFWWFNMYSSVDVSVTPRPMYCADGRKIPDVYTEPPSWRDDLQRELGRFPLFQFWGPGASIASTRWIAEAAKRVWTKARPSLSLVYLPHLDYDLQKYGPDDRRIDATLAELDDVLGDLLAFYAEHNVRVIVLAEYGIVPVRDAVALNRILREDGALRVRDELGHEQLDVGASAAFAVADHQVAHVYVLDPEAAPRYADLLEGVPGVAAVLDRAAQARGGLDHPRGGELVVVADRDRWFSYDYWLDDARAPDFARTVDIHRKPGYDPRELFLDPKLAAPKLTIARKLAARRLGFRTLLDVIPLDTSLVRGSHGRIDNPAKDQPLILADASCLGDEETLSVMGVRDVILRSVFG